MPNFLLLNYWKIDEVLYKLFTEPKFNLVEKKKRGGGYR